MIDFLKDDLNTSGAFGVLFDNLTTLQENQEAKAFVKHFLINVFGLTLKALPEKSVPITPEIEALIEQREQARISKNWALADQIRDKLINLGVNVHDKKLK